jgi:predicted transcriptional regulator
MTVAKLAKLDGRYDVIRAPRHELGMRRRELGISQTELAAKIGVSRYFIAACEVGIRDPSMGVASRWLRELQINPDETPISWLLAHEVPV